ncbi:MAG: M48 family metallopeptidase [Armatimonadota bacterium]
MSTRWRGHYLDGRTAARYPVLVILTREGLTLRREDDTTLWWPFDQVRLTQGSNRGDHVRFERGGEYPEVLVVTDPGFLAAVHQIAPHLRGRFQAPSRVATRAVVVLLAAAGAIALGAALYVWGIPALADVAATRVPVSWEDALGAQVVDSFVPQKKRCRSAEGSKALDRIVSTLVAAAPRSPYTFRVTVANQSDVNALAAPGGHIVIFRGLLEDTKTPEELAGVMAHEIQHVLHRHATRGIFRELSLAVLLRIVTGGGDISTLEVARALGGLRYQRADEETADREGMKMVQAARIDPQGMVAAYAGLQRAAEKMGEPPAYLSSHPSTAGRLAHLRRMASEARYTPITLLPGVRWAQVREMCGRPGSIPGR